MRFHLVDGGSDLAELRQVHKTVRIKIAHANGAYLSGPVRFFHGPVSAVVIVERLVDEQQIQIIRAQPAQGFVNGRLRLLIPAVGNPHLRGKEQLFPRNPALLRCAAYGFLIAVNLRGINRTVADLNRIQHAAFALLSVRNLKNAKSQDRHRNAIVQHHFFHHSFFYCF